MSTLDYHSAHEPYISAVVDALQAAGIAVSDGFADPNDPRDGYITLDIGDEDKQTVIGWTEEKGWMFGSGPESGPLKHIWGFPPSDVLLDPTAVVEQTERLLGGDFAGTDDYRGIYRRFEDEDGFEERLAVYHAAGSEATA